jgi:hypothetical protein
MGAKVATGSYVGTGAAKSVALPFNPAVIIILNRTDNIISIKSNQDLPGTHRQIAANGAISEIATEGVSIPDIVAGPASVADFFKFTLGTAAGVNGATKECSYIAWEGAPAS